jgi:hypothetical protein
MSTQITSPKKFSKKQSKSQSRKPYNKLNKNKDVIEILKPEIKLKQAVFDENEIILRPLNSGVAEETPTEPVVEVPLRPLNSGVAEETPTEPVVKVPLRPLNNHQTRARHNVRPKGGKNKKPVIDLDPLALN